LRIRKENQFGKLNSGGVKMADVVPFDILVRVSTVVLAVGLFIISFLAYLRNKRKILFYVSIAFFLYFARGIIKLINTEMFILSISFSDVLDLLTLVLIFFAVVKE
jgi:hypothetical protein